MKYFLALLGLISLANCDATHDSSKDKMETQVSKTVTLPVNVVNEGEVKINYYTKKLTDSKTKKVSYELHGNCYLFNLEVAKYNMTVERTVSCEVALSEESPPKVVDAMILSSKLKLNAPDKAVWAC
jgi:hypothetical protein